MSNIITVPFSQLVRDEKNVRKHGRDTAAYKAGIEAMAASILAQGVLQNLVAYRVPGTDAYAVSAGGRRFDAITLLVQRGEKPTDWPVSVKEISEAEATAASLAENIQREAMNPADEFDAFTTLTAEGWTIDRIADAHGVTPVVVERRLKLAKASPALIAKFRDGELSTDQMIALCSTDDHAVQLAVWERQGHDQWSNSPKDLRRAVLARDVEAEHDYRVAFLGGIASYEAAGGEVRRDLFSGDGAGTILTNPALLDDLVADKLASVIEAVKAEGWAWVDRWESWDHTADHRLGTIEPNASTMPEEASAQVQALEAERDALHAEQRNMHATAEAEDRDDLTDAEYERDSEIDERVEAIENEIEQIAAAHATYSEDVKAKAGVVVCLSAQGLKISRGRVKAADRKQLVETLGDTTAIQGGRETEPAGRKGDAVSDALRRSLLGHRNLAVQAVTATRPDVAKVLLAVWTVKEIRRATSDAYLRNDSPTDLTIGSDQYGSGTRTNCPISDDSGKARKEAFVATLKAATKGLPSADGPLWDALAALSGDQLDTLIAHGVALTVSLTEEHNGLTAKLTDALAFDMAEHIEATEETYLGRVSKPLMLEALTEAGKVKDDADRTALLAKKKGELATEAANRLAGSGWVPKGIRTPKPKKAAAPKAKQPAKATTKAPAKKATGKAPAKAVAKAPAPAKGKAAAPAQAHA